METRRDELTKGEHEKRMKVKGSDAVIVAALACWEGCSWLYSIQVLGHCDYSFLYVCQISLPIWGFVELKILEMADFSHLKSSVEVSSTQRKWMRMAAATVFGVAQIILTVLPFLLLKPHGSCKTGHPTPACFYVAWIVTQGHLFLSFLRYFNSLYNLLACVLVGVVCTCNFKGFGDGGPHHRFAITALAVVVLFLSRLVLSLHPLETAQTSTSQLPVTDDHPAKPAADSHLVSTPSPKP